ncbi:MAG TPA: ferredoxin reductase family protein [Kineosporiaceae bacterium]
MAEAMVRGRQRRSREPDRRSGRAGLDSLGLPVGARVWAIGVLAAGLAGTLVLWATHHGARDLMSPGARVTSLGRLTGLLCALFFALALVMMARPPRLERAFGQDQLVRLHRAVGVGAFFLMLAHIVLVTWGYSAGAGLGLVAEFKDLVVNYDNMIPATVATGLMILVVLSSVRMIRRRLRYETWHLLHLWVYVGVGLAVPHETSLGTDLEGATFLRIGWWAAWVLLAAAVLAWRIGRPVMMSLRHQLVVQDVVRENVDSVSIYMRGRNLLDLGAQPGQFFVWRFMTGRGWTRGHPFSLSAVPTDERLRITVRDLGDGSGAVSRLRPGIRVLAEGPYGRMHPGVHPGGPAVLVASGIGITPLRAMLERLRAGPGELTVLYRVTDPDRLVFAGEIELLARMRGFRVHYLVGPRRRTRRRPSWVPESAGIVSDAQILQLLVPGVAGHEVYVCGPPGWADSVRQAALEAGVPAARIHSEFIDW